MKNKSASNGATARMSGSDKAIAKQHEKYTARERIAMLLDEGSFEEMDMLWNTDAEFRHGEKTLSERRCSNRLCTIEGRLVYILHRISPFLPVLCQETMSLKIWVQSNDQAMKWGALVSVSMTRVAHVFKKVSMRWPVMLKFSNAIFFVCVIPQILNKDNQWHNALI